MQVQGDVSGIRVSEFAIALAVSGMVAAIVLWTLVALNPARQARAMMPLEPDAQQSIAIKPAVHGEWFRKSPGWLMPGQGDAPAFNLPHARSEAALAQQRLATHIAERYRVDHVQAASVVALAFEVADELTIDPLLILAVIAVESSFDAAAQSPRGAQGLMQIRTHLHAALFEAFGGPEAAFEPHANIRVGAELLRGFLSREGSVEAALKLYVGAARRPHDGGYGQRVIRARDALRGIAQQRDELVFRGALEQSTRLGAGS